MSSRRCASVPYPMAAREALWSGVVCCPHAAMPMCARLPNPGKEVVSCLLKRIDMYDADPERRAPPASKVEPTAEACKAEAPASAPAAGAASKDDSLYGTDPNTCRLSRRLSPEDFNAICVTAGISLRCE